MMKTMVLLLFLFFLRAKVYPTHRGLPMRHTRPATAGSFTLRNRGLGEKAPQRTSYSQAKG